MPIPRIQLLVCTNERPEGARKPCCGRGDEALAIYRAFKDGVRARGLRDDVMVVRTGCLKHCSHGIAVAQWPANRWFTGVTRSDVDDILDRSVVADEDVKRLRMPDVPWE